jgi:hypothetical protein
MTIIMLLAYVSAFDMERFQERGCICIQPLIKDDNVHS